MKYFGMEGIMNKRKQISILLTVLVLIPVLSFAGESGLPWETPLQTILDSITGPFLKFSCIVAVIITGLLLAFGELSGMLRRIIQVVLGLSIACSASSFGLEFFNFAGGLLF